jgi:hypothetical protein
VVDRRASFATPSPHRVRSPTCPVPGSPVLPVIRRPPGAAHREYSYDYDSQCLSTSNPPPRHPQKKI